MKVHVFTFIHRKMNGDKFLGKKKKRNVFKNSYELAKYSNASLEELFLKKTTAIYYILIFL